MKILINNSIGVKLTATISIVCLLFITTLRARSANSETAIKETVNKWCQIHNTKDIEAFKTLYASDVLFYGKYTDIEKCVKIKSELLKHSFYQEIVAPVRITYYSSGTIKCSFIKKVTYDQHIREYPSYLLLEKREQQYLVTGESDLITDQNLHTQLNLGQEIIPSNKNYPLVYSVLGLSLLVGIGFYLRKKWKASKVTIEATDDADFINTKEEEPIVIESSSIKPKELTDKEKGDAFENFVLDKFKAKFHNLKERRSDKFHNGRYPLSNMHPDLVFEFRSKMHQAKTFAVECKWRTSLFKGGIEWAKDYQLRNYKKYEKDHNMSVFVIIGTGGKPDNPHSLYIIPLKEIYSNVLSEDQLTRYRRHTKGNFFLHTESMELR